MRFLVIATSLVLLICAAEAQTGSANAVSAAAPKTSVIQPNDEGYTAQIRKFTTAPVFTTELVDHLPASKLPTPERILGHIAGAPDVLTYSADVYRYFRALEKASKRVQVLTIGQTEEGREIIMALISDEQNITRRDEHRRIAARLADPRGLTPADAEEAIGKLVPMYWITGSIHSPECGSPEMLMELAYRLAADESPMYQRIRKNWIVAITPVIEVDGHDRFVDLYRWHKANPGRPVPPLIYWGHYVAHDNNRDAMGLSLALTRAAMRTFLDWHPLIMHDLHESVPYLYDNTLGTEPFNAWLDPIVTNEWEDIAWHNVNEMTKRGVPGVFTFGTFTTWDPSYLYFIANSHNSIGRLYETFGNGGADTRYRELTPQETERTWWRPNPPLARTQWSMRDNNNYQQSAILFSLDYLSGKREEYVRNFYLKSQRAVAKAQNEGPAGYVLPANDPRPQLQADLLNLLQMQGAEVHRATQAFKVTLEVRRPPQPPPAASPGAAQEETQSAPAPQPATILQPREFPAGSYIVRMDQPYSRIADMLLDQQYYSPDDRRPYDDSGWSAGPLHNVEVVRITDKAVLNAATQKVQGPVQVNGGTQGAGAVLAIDNNAIPELGTLRFLLHDVAIEVAEAPFKNDSAIFHAGTFLIPNSARARLDAAAKQLGLNAISLPEMPKVAHHTLAAPRIALLHTWTSTQNEGWYRLAFDRLKIPYTYMSDQTVRDTADLRTKFDVILFPPVGNQDSPGSIISGLGWWNPPLPWQKTDVTPNLGSPDATGDMRGGMGFAGVEHLRQFVDRGGLLITVMDTSSVPISFGIAQGVGAVPPRNLHARGVVLNAQFMPTNSPIAYGYGPRMSVYFNDGPLYRVTYRVGQFGFGGSGPDDQPHRPSGRGSADSPDVPQARAYEQPLPDIRPKPWEAPYISKDIDESGMKFLLPEQFRPRVVLRFADAPALLHSGQLSSPAELAGRPAVIDAPIGKGHVVMFSINPVWRGETQGSYALLLNAILNYDHLDLGHALPPAQAPPGLQPAVSSQPTQEPIKPE
jgi:hypothetical protein